MLRFWLVVCAYGSTTLFLPGALDTASAQVLKCRAKQTNASTLIQPRAELADRWMLYLKNSEQTSFSRTHLLSVLAFGAATVAWSVGLATHSDPHNWDSVGSSGPGLAAATALSLGFTLASLSTQNSRIVAAIDNVGGAFEFAMGSAVLTLATHETCDLDCGLVLSSDTLAAVGSAVVGLIIQGAYPPIYVSDHYSRYTRLTDPEQRYAYALDLMRRQESRKRTAGQISLVYSVALGAAYVFAATQTKELSDKLIMGLSGGALALSALVSLLMNIWETTPSERLLANLPP